MPHRPLRHPSCHPDVTLLGFGAFGALIAGLLAPHCTLRVHDPDPAARDRARAAGHRVAAGLAETRGSDIVLLAVPLGALGSCLAGIAPHLRAGQIVADLCSVKEEPARLMQALLPPGVELLATHPMFGPNSARTGVAGCQLVLCPLRGTGWRRPAAFLRRVLGLEILLTTPEAHDREAARTQALVHLLAGAIADPDPGHGHGHRHGPGHGRRPRLRTRSYDLLSEALAMVRGDAPEVRAAITGANRHVGPVREALLQALQGASQPEAPTDGGPHALPGPDAAAG